MDIDSYKFWDVVKLWGREELEHDVLVSRKLAVGIIKEGLRFQSTDPNWLKPSEELLSYPYVGYTSLKGEPPIIIKAAVLEHLLAVASKKLDTSKQILTDESVKKSDFETWLIRMGQAFPDFWFSNKKLSDSPNSG